MDSDISSVTNVHVWCRVETTADNPVPPVFRFTGKPGLQVENVEHDCLSYMRLFLDVSIMKQIVNETNRYAAQCQ